MHACMHAGMHAYIHACICTRARLHTYTHTYMHACMHAYMHTCTHAHMHTCIHAPIHIRPLVHQTLVFMLVSHAPDRSRFLNFKAGTISYFRRQGGACLIGGRRHTSVHVSAHDETESPNF